MEVGRYMTPVTRQKMPVVLHVRPRGARHRLVLLAALVLATPAVRAQQAASADRSKPLEGRWSVELSLDPLSLQNPPPAEKITGEVAFGTGSWWNPTDRFGRHSVDTRPFFGRLYAAPTNVAHFTAADTSLFTEVSGGVIGDSVGIDFLPRLDHGGLSFWGRFYGDSARGRWHRRGADGSGRFVLKRISNEAVAIAAIPVPGAAATLVVAAAPATKSTAKGRGKGAKPSMKGDPKIASAPAATNPATQSSVATSVVANTPAATNTVAQPSVAQPSVAQPSVAKATVAQSPIAPPPSSTRAPAAGSLPTAASALTTAGSQKSVPTTTSTTASTTPAPPPPAPAKVAGTTTANAAPRPRFSRTAPADPTATGAVRVRMLDLASKKWFVTRYQLHLPDGSFKWGDFRSGAEPDGFGPVVPSRPGRYEVEVENFVCGDKFWFFAKKVVRPVVVTAGDTTDVTIDLDLSTEPAKKTIDNKTGALCTAGPGTPR